MVFRKTLLSAVLMLAALPALAQTTEVSVTFDQGVIGEFGNNTGQANNVVNTGNLGFALITFSQESDNGRFGGSQGNDYCGTLTLSGASTISFPACVNWRVTVTGTTHYIGFVPADLTSHPGSPISLPYSGPLPIQSYNVVIDAELDNESPESNFAFRTNTSAPSYADGDDVSGNAAASSALESLNSYLDEVSDTTDPVISGPGSTTVDGMGEDQTQVTEGATSVETFAVDEEVTWTLEGADAGFFRIDLDGASFDGKLSFLDPVSYDPEWSNVYTIDVVATDAAGNRSVMTFTVTVVPASAGPVITGPGSSTVNGTGQDETEVTEGATSVETFSVDEEVTWTLEGEDADLFRIDLDGMNYDGELSFVDPIAIDPNGDNVYVVDIVATDGDGNRAVLTFTVTVLQYIDTTKPAITGPGATTVDGQGTDQTEVRARTTEVATFSTDEDVVWELDGPQAELFRINWDGMNRGSRLSFEPAREFDAETPSNNVYVVDVVAIDITGNRSVLTFTVTVLPPEEVALIQGPSESAGAWGSEALVPVGETDIHRFTAVDENGDPMTGTWSIRDLDVDMFTIDPETGLLSFFVAPDYNPGGNNTYEVRVVFSYGDSGETSQVVMVEVLGEDDPAPALAMDRAQIETVILEAEIVKLRGQQGSLRAMTASARDRLSQGGCGASTEEDVATGSDTDEACRVEDNDLNVSVSAMGASISGHDRRVLSYGGYRRISSIDLAVMDQDSLRTLSFNGYFALEDHRAENALYGVFAGVSFSSSNVNRAVTGRSDSFGVSLGAYAVHELRPNLFSEVYLSLGRSRHGLDLTDGTVEVAADYDTTEAHLGWVLSGEIQQGRWDILPEFGVQLSHSDSSAIAVTGATPDDLTSETWQGLAASLARVNVSTEFRYHVGGRTDDAWVVATKPGLVCERVSAATERSGCGVSVNLGLDQTSTDGTHRFSADVGAEEIDGVRRQSATLSYELRF